MKTVAIRERPMLFSAPMIIALLARQKTQTRRALRKQPFESEHRPGEWLVSEGRSTYATNRRRREVFKGDTLESVEEYLMPLNEWLLERSPFKVGQRLWVREKHHIESRQRVTYAADMMSWGIADWIDSDTGDVRPNAKLFGKKVYGDRGIRWRSPIHMPRWASRITLEITEVRVERVQDISDDDAIAEGMDGRYIKHEAGDLVRFSEHGGYTPVKQYEMLWESINGKGSWAANPLCSAVTFKVVPT